MAGCFGGSAIDRWMEANCDRHTDGDYGTRIVDFKLFKGKKLIREFTEELSNEDDDSSDVMMDTLKGIYKKKVQRWYNAIKEYSTLIGGSRKQGYYICDQETMTNYRLDQYNDKYNDPQTKIIETWSMMPKPFGIENNGFNMLRMGKYSVTCYDKPQD